MLTIDMIRHRKMQEILDSVQPLLNALVWDLTKNSGTTQEHEDLAQEGRLFILDEIGGFRGGSIGEFIAFVRIGAGGAMRELLYNNSSVRVPGSTRRRYKNGDLSPEMMAAVRDVDEAPSYDEFVEEGGASLLGEELGGVKRVNNVAPGVSDDTGNVAAKQLDVASGLDELNDRERYVICSLFGLDGYLVQSVGELAKAQACSSQRISFIKSGALLKMRESIGERDDS